MKRYIKKIISILLAVCLVICPISIFAEDKAREAEDRLTSLGITLEGELDAEVKRAEIVSIIVKLVTNNAQFPVPTTPVFDDVGNENYAAGDIYYAYQMGWISGVTEHSFAPDNPASLQQFLKVATSALGYRIAAEKEGGYAGGYYNIAIKLGLLEGLKLSESLYLTKNDVLILLNNMLDAKTLEPVFATDTYEESRQTLFEQLMQRDDIKEITGVVEAVEKYYLSNGKELSDGRIMIEGIELLYDGANAKELLGKKVKAYYKDSAYTALPTVMSVSVHEQNTEITIDAEDIVTFDSNELVYNDAENKIRRLSVSGSEFIYNGSVITPGEINIPVCGTVNLVDRENDKKYDVAFITEYESFIVDRISEGTHTVYFKNDAIYRGKTGFWFDYENKDKEYIILSADGEEVEFSDIAAGMVFSVAANKAETLVTVMVSDKVAEGAIVVISSDDYELTIGEETYKLYKANAEALLAEYNLADEGKFALNHYGEIVGTVGELYSDELYAYVTGYDGGSFSKPAQIKLLVSGTSNKEVEVSGDDEIIKYTYSNGDMAIYELEQKVKLSFSGGSESKVDSKDISASTFNRTAVRYKLNADGKISRLDVYSVPLYTTAQLATYYAFSFNGKLNSFGGYAAKDAFFIGETTQVISIPTNDSPDEDDYTVDVSISDGGSYTIMPINIDETSQVAECAVLFANMDANTPKPFGANDKISIVGGKRVIFDENREEYYKLDVLVENKVKNPVIYSGSAFENILSRIVCGDLIRYNTKANGEIGNIELLQSLHSLGNSYFINREGSADEACFAKVESITLNRLDNLRNERVDTLLVSTGTREKLYTILREDGPAVYSYNRATGEIKVGVTDDIASADRVGEGASDVFLFVNENEPKVIVILVD